MQRTDVLIIGDGPTGLSAALLLSKNGQDVVVMGKDETPMHKAYLENFLGLRKVRGTAFMERAREHVEAFGTELVTTEVSDVAAENGGFVVSGTDGTEVETRYLVLATGGSQKLAERLGVVFEDDRVRVDLDGRTSEDRVYAGGWLARGAKIQAAISVGDGAAIALDILSRELGKPFHDFDTPPE